MNYINNYKNNYENIKYINNLKNLDENVIKNFNKECTKNDLDILKETDYFVINKKKYKICDFYSYSRTIIFEFCSLKVFVDELLLKYNDISLFLNYIKNIIEIFIPNQKNLDYFKCNLYYSDHTIALRNKTLLKLLYYLKYNFNENNKEMKYLMDISFSLINFNLYLIKNTNLERVNNNHALDQCYYGLLCLDSLNLNYDYILYFKKKIIKEINYQFIDGIHIENTPVYHITTMNILRLLLNKLKHIFVQEELNYIINIYKNACKHIINILTPIGTLPGLGDEFEDKVNINDIIDKKLFNIKYIPNEIIIQEKSGYSIFRNKQLYFLIKCSNNSYYHKHYDDGSFILYYKNIKFVTDAGCFNYEYKNINRAYVTHSNSHNVFNLLLKNQYNKPSLYSDHLFGWSGNCRGSGYSSSKIYKYSTELKNIDNSIHCKTNMFKNINYNRIFNFKEDIIVIKDIININEINDNVELCSLLHIPLNINCIKESDNIIILEHNNIQIKIEITSNNFNKYEIVKGLYKNQLVGYFSPTWDIIEENQCIIFFFNNTKTLEYDIKLYLI